MKNIPVKYQVTFGLVCLLVSIMSLVASIGIAPDEQSAVLRGRGKLCGAVAINASMLVNRNDLRGVEQMLTSVVDRNEEIKSAAVRAASGRIRVAVGDHSEVWVTDIEQPVETHMSVDLRVGSHDWGTLEMCFEPIFADRLTASWIGPGTLYISMVGILSFGAFAFYLGRVLKQLDPSQAVPQHVEDALNTLTEGLILTDAKGYIRLANEAFAKWMQCSTRELIGIAPDEFSWTNPDGCDDKTMPWQIAIENGVPVSGRLIQLPGEHEQMMTLIANASPIVGAKGDYVGVLTSFEDVTDLENHKTELSKAKEVADLANRAKSDFLARMSHEIRTPMNAILGYAEVLRENLEEDPNVRQRHLNTIHNSGEHLLELINDILDLSKIESGQMELELAPVSIHQVLSEIESVLKIKAEEKGVYLRCDFDGPLPEVIQTDAVRVKQTIINLIGNAIKFTEKGGVTIRPQLVSGKDQYWLKIAVVDTGIGMNEEALAKVFNPFSQADTSITRRFGGTGLGLSICKELAEKMGGEISVESQVGVGSVFTLTIGVGDLKDVALVDEHTFEQKEAIRRQSECVEVGLPPMHVLVVDDSETNRQLVAVYLKKENITFDVAENGQQAIEKVNAIEFDAVLMDMHMPVMDGFEATRTLRAQGCQTSIIALTANAMAKDEKECRDAGCSGFLTKPISRNRLRNELSKISVSPERQSMLAKQTMKAATSTVSAVPMQQVQQHQPTDSCRSDLKAEQEEAIVSSLPMDDEDFVMVANMFVDGLAVKSKLMVEALEARNYQQLFELGHWLKGAGGSAGYEAFIEVGSDLETAAKAHDAILCRDKLAQICMLANRTEVRSKLPATSV